MHDESILAVIPAWNEETHIVPVVEKAREHLEVLVVDDGSHDKTSALAKAHGAFIFQHGENLGKGRALISGFTWAMEQGYDAVITLDADEQHDPSEIPKFLDAYYADEGELIIGKRNFNQMPFPNRVANPFGSWLLSLALNHRIYDNQSGYRLHTRRLLENIDLISSGFDLEVEVVIRAVCEGFRIGWVPIRTIYGTGKVSYFHPIHDSRRFLAMVWNAYRYRKGISGKLGA